MKKKYLIVSNRTTFWTIKNANASTDFEWWIYSFLFQNIFAVNSIHYEKFKNTSSEISRSTVSSMAVNNFNEYNFRVYEIFSKNIPWAFSKITLAAKKFVLFILVEIYVRWTFISFLIVP